MADLIDYSDEYYNGTVPRTAPPDLGSDLISARAATPAQVLAAPAQALAAPEQALDAPPATVLTVAVTTSPVHVNVPPPRGGNPAAPTYSQAAKGKTRPPDSSSTCASAPAPTPTVDLHALARNTSVLTQKASIISELL